MKLVTQLLCVTGLVVAAGLIGYTTGYENGHKTGYDAGYSAGYSDRNKLVDKPTADAVTAHTKTETRVIYQKIPYTGSDVQVRTEKPVVTVSVNGKQQEVKQHSETADLAVKTETAVRVKIPERRWKFGIGTDGRKPAYMLSAPIKGAVGAWVAGSGKNKIMGGVTVSF